jgi:MATE family multidrug resistance protein
MQMYSNIVTLFTHLVISYILVVHLKKGIVGIALAMSINYFLRFAVLQVFIYYSHYQKDLISIFRKRSRRNLLYQLKLGLKSVFMGIWQHWSYQMYSVIAMLFMNANVIAAQHICINIVSIFHVIPIALAMAFSVFVGNMIGAGKTKEAREYVKLSIITGTVWGLVCGSVLIAFK